MSVLTAVARGCLLMLAACVAAPAPEPVIDALAADLPAFVERHLREQGVPGICVAVLDVDPASGLSRTWARGFGVQRPGGPPMAADAVHRVASISKLYTATAAMVLVERGVLDLDVPVARYLPEFAPQNAFGGSVTLRQLLGHRSGLVREGPVGHYFDPSEPTLAATVASLNGTALVHAPGSVFKYSNHGVAIVGEVIARVTGKPFAAAVHELVLAPLNLRDSDFAPRADLMARAADGVMWTYDGRAIPTPHFRFGYPPAAELRSTVVDLLAFARSWLPNAPRSVLQAASQLAMWALPIGENAGCGLGFFMQDFAGQRQVGHDGSVYGFASTLRALPDAGLAVAVVCTKDFSNAVAEAIAARALTVALAVRTGDLPPSVVFPQPLGAARARQLAGRWRVGENHVRLYAEGDDLFYDPNLGVRTRLRVATDGGLVSDDPLSLGDRRLAVLDDGRLHDGQEYYVREDDRPLACSPELASLIGEYGWDHDVLVVYEDEGRLGVLVEWVVRDLPDRIGPDDYVFPPGMYGGDRLHFERDQAGSVVAVVLGGARFIHRAEAPGGFRIKPQRPIAELLAEAAALAAPTLPSERRSDLVDLATLDPTLRIDLRYATADNFVGAPVYPPSARALLQRPAAEALLRVHRELAERGFGLWIFDAYRPWSVTKVFWEATPPPLREFVADPANGSRHNRGCAVDLTLYELGTGEPVGMPSEFDEFTPRAYPHYPGGTSAGRWCRELLRRTMESAGFAVNSSEWWHFDHADWQRYPVGNSPL